jgi:hypothetical protein
MDILEIMSGHSKLTSKAREIQATTKRWEGLTPLLNGLKDSRKQLVKSNMATLLENTVASVKKQLLTETSSMASGDVQGFSVVALPMIRRIFAKIIANEIVSVQPMQSPTGLIFYLDFTAGSDKGVGHVQGASIYGGGRVGSGLLQGIDLDNFQESGFYNLNQGYTSPTGSAAPAAFAAWYASGTVGDGTASVDKVVEYDPDLEGKFVGTVAVLKSAFPQLNSRSYMSVTDLGNPAVTSGTLLRRHTKDHPTDATRLLLTYTLDTATVSFANAQLAMFVSHTFKYAIDDDFTSVGGTLGAVTGDPTWGLEFGGNTGENEEIPQIDIKITSTDITAKTRKLRARWTPEISQDIDAYQNLDAEVEVTSILSEHIEQELDAEVLNDLILAVHSLGTGSNKNIRYWSRRPGHFVDPVTGATLGSNAAGDFTGNFVDWNMNCLMVLNDLSALIYRKNLRGGATFLVTSPEVCSILESTNPWMADVTVDSEKAGAGTYKAGTLNRKWDIFVCPYFRRNLILVGRKGTDSPLETGYVYAPYVPIQVTPAIPDPNTFVLNKGVMTRYGKKLLRPDFYGLLVVRDLVG